MQSAQHHKGPDPCAEKATAAPSHSPNLTTLAFERLSQWAPALHDSFASPVALKKNYRPGDNMKTYRPHAAGEPGSSQKEPGVGGLRFADGSLDAESSYVPLPRSVVP